MHDSHSDSIHPVETFAAFTLAAIMFAVLFI